jgi:hypothetical protein
MSIPRDFRRVLLLSIVILVLLTTLVIGGALTAKAHAARTVASPVTIADVAQGTGTGK